ncbi:general amidase [Sparassis latifolia]
MSAGVWKEQVADKRKRQQEAIPPEWRYIDLPSNDQLNVLDVPATCGLLTPLELEITNVSDVSVLLKQLASAQWSSVQVTTAFCKRAVIAHQLTNCLTEIFFARALDRAAELDEYLKQHGTVMGPLHGLPISLKDQFCVKGLETVMGYAAWIGKVAAENAVLVDLLLDCGAVLYVRTNLPQTLMWAETNNNVFGRTVNPYNRNFAAGGSSGGEGSLIAMHGSILGAATDVAGSIRIPAHFCGIYGFKPSAHRIPSYGISDALDGQDSIPTCIGPLSSSLSGLMVFFQAVLSKQPWRRDPRTLNKPWDQDAYMLKGQNEGEQLCFGLLWNEGTITPTPPVNRALEQTKAALEKAGHIVINWEPFKHKEFYVNARAIWTSDGYADYRASVNTGEPLLHSMKPDADPSDVPPHRRPREPLSSFDVWQLNKERRELRKAHLDYWESSITRTGTGRPVDALICPGGPYPAVPHGHARPSFYTWMWNSLDYPVLAIPVTKVDASQDVKPPPHKFLSADDEGVYQLYDPVLFDGLPVGIQVMCPTQHEEMLLAIGKIVDKSLHDIGKQ